MTGSAPPPIPLTIVTGPAAAGKSRLIASLMAHPDRAAAFALSSRDDGSRFSAGSRAMPNPASCLCCAGTGALSALLEAILRAIDNGRMTGISHLFFETDGSADPMRAAGEIYRHPYLSRRFALTGIVAVAPVAEPADAATWESQRSASAAIVTPDEPAAAHIAMAKRFDPSTLPDEARRRLFAFAPRTLR